jgi:hypothetical protein
MFRKGGSTNGMTGIMSGIQDRNNYQDAGRVGELTKEYQETLLKGTSQDEGFDPLTTFLLQYGPALATARPGGNIVSTALGAAQEPVQSLLTEQAERRKFLRDIKSGAAQLAIEQAGKEKLQAQELEAKQEMLEQQLAATGDEKLSGLTDTYMRQKGYDFIPAQNMAKAQINDIPGKIRSKFGETQYGGVIEPGTDLEKFAKRQGKKNNTGQVFFDLTDGKSKRLRKTTDGTYMFEPVMVEQQEIEEGVVTPAPGEEKIVGEEIKTTETKEVPQSKFRTMEEYQEYLREQQGEIFKKVPVEQLGQPKLRTGRG